MNMVMLRPNERETRDRDLCFNNPAQIGVCGCGQQATEGAAGTAAFLASRAIFFMAVNLSGVRISYTAPGDSCGSSGCVYEIALKIRLFFSSRKMLLGMTILWG